MPIDRLARLLVCIVGVLEGQRELIRCRHETIFGTEVILVHFCQDTADPADRESERICEHVLLLGLLRLC